MNQIFASSRFQSYFKLYTRENSRRILMLYAFVVILPIIAVLILPYMNNYYLFQSNSDRMWEIELLTFDFLLIAMGSYFSSMFYSGLAGKEKRMSFLMTPTSAFEKFLTLFLIYVVGFMIVFVIATVLADIIRVAAYSSTAHEHKAAIDFISPEYVLTQSMCRETYFTEVIDYHHKMAIMANCVFFSLFFFLQSSFALGSSVWPKNSFIKTFMSNSAIFILCVFLFFVGMNTFFDMDDAFKMRFGENNPAEFGYIVVCFSAVFTLACWIISYIRFREWEAINRW